MKQTKRFKQFAVGISFALSLSLTACSGSNNDADITGTPPVVTDAPVTEPSVDPTAQTTAAPTNEPATNTDDKQTDKHSDVGLTVGSLFELAKEGKVPDCSYAASIALFDDIEKKWGKADTNEAAGKGIYAEYKNKGITFGYNKGMKVFDVRSYSSKLQKITLKDIKSALGKADEESVNGKDDIYTYKVNDTYELKFIIPQSSGKVDHISVFSPQDTKNNMAG